MSKHYKKFILLVIPACVGFCLALALGWAEESSEFTQEEFNKALVKEAILAFDEDPYDKTLPELFDPNYVQYGPSTPFHQTPRPHFSGIFDAGQFITEPVTFDSIIAEGDMVSVCLIYTIGGFIFYDPDFVFMELAIYRISRGKIVEGWVSHTCCVPAI